MLCMGGGAEREQWRLVHSLPDFSQSLCYPQSNCASLVLIPEWVACARSRPLWVSPTSSPVRLGVSPAATSTPCFFSLRGLRLYFPALEPWVVQSVSLPCRSSWFLSVRMWGRDLPATTLWGLLAVAWPAPFHNLPPRWVHQPPPCCESSPPWLPASAPPTSLDECFFFIFLVVKLPYSSIFCQFWLLFVFKLLLSFFWLCEEAQCVYLLLHLGRKLPCSRCSLYL